MAWLALQMIVGAAHAEAIAEALLEQGAESVSTEDADAGSAQEAPVYAEPTSEPTNLWPRNRIVALVPTDADAAALVCAAARAAGLEPPPVRAVRIENEDWVRRTQSQFGPQRAGKRLWIVPRWCPPPSDPAATVLRLDPGLAFGTGSHPSTRLVLAWLEATLRGGEQVLDYGCGSGILALAAARLGAGRVTATDIDPQALDACRANARDNDIVVHTAAPDALALEEVDVLVANILAGPLISLAPELAARTRCGGRIALAGILAAQADEVVAAYASAFAMRAEADEEGWVLLAGVRR